MGDGVTGAGPPMSARSRALIADGGHVLDHSVDDRVAEAAHVLGIDGEEIARDVECRASAVVH